MRRLDFRQKLLLALFLTSVFPLLATNFISYREYSKEMELQASDAVELTLRSTEANLTSRLLQLRDAAFLFMTNEQLHTTLEGSGSSSYEKIMNNHQIDKIIQFYKTTYNLYRIRLYLEDTSPIAVDRVQVFPIEQLPALPVLGQDWKRMDTGMQWSPIRLESALNNPELLSVYAMLRNSRNEELGVVFLDIPVLEFTRELAKLNGIGQIRSFLVDAGQTVIASNQTGFKEVTVNDPHASAMMNRSDGIYKNKDHLYVIKTITISNWKVIAQIPLETLLAKNRQIRSRMLLIAAGCLLLIVLISVILSGNLTKRLKLLLQAMAANRYRHGETIQDIPVAYASRQGDELDKLIYTYNRMARRISRLINQVYKVRAEESEARFQALQAQINPHFLYNALDSIKSCLDNRQNEIASQMIVSLAHFFRIALSKGKDKITIEKEIEMIREYMNIQKLHYGNKFDWSVNVDPNILPFLITRFTLQPIIENALLHGIRNKREKGRIEVRGRFCDERIELTVEDNGIGMSSEQLISLLEVLDQARFSLDRGYGLNNVNARLKLQFGKSYGLRISSVSGEGTIVRIVIPQEV